MTERIISSCNRLRFLGTLEVRLVEADLVNLPRSGMILVPTKCNLSFPKMFGQNPKFVCQNGVFEPTRHPGIIQPQ